MSWYELSGYVTSVKALFAIVSLSFLFPKKIMAIYYFQFVLIPRMLYCELRILIFIGVSNELPDLVFLLI